MFVPPRSVVPESGAAAGSPAVRPLQHAAGNLVHPGQPSEAGGQVPAQDRTGIYICKDGIQKCVDPVTELYIHN